MGATDSMFTSVNIQKDVYANIFNIYFWAMLNKKKSTSKNSFS